MNEKDILAINLSRDNHGVSYNTIRKILEKLTNDEVKLLSYQIQRTADRFGPDALNCEYLPTREPSPTI